MINRILVQFDYSNLSPEQYSETLKDLENAGQAHPRGRNYHIALLKENSITIEEIWESEETLNAFTKILYPILINNAISPIKPTLVTIHNIISF